MKAKNIYKLCLFCFLAFSVTSCLYEDKGNYDYKEINDVTITGIDQNVNYKVVSFVDTLRIEPGIDCKLDADPKHFEYQWVIQGSGTDSRQDTIGTDKNLAYPVMLKAGNYKGLFKVYDKISDLKWTQTFKITVSAVTTEGWTMLCNQQGKSRIDMLHPVDENHSIIAREIFDGGDLVGEPVSLNFMGGLTSNLYLNSTKSSILLAYADLSIGEESDLKYEFGMTPAQVDGRAIEGTTTWGFSSDNICILVDKKGDLYVRKNYDDLYGFRANHLAKEEQYFEVAPFIGVRKTKDSQQKYHSVMLYDNTNKRFLEIPSGALLPRVMTYENMDLWPSPTTGKDIVYMESTLNYTYAILKDPGSEGGKRWLYCVDLGDKGKNIQKYCMEIPGDAVRQAKTFAFHSLYPYVFYAAGGDVYRYDYSVDKTDKVLSYPDGVVCKLSFSIYLGWVAYQAWEKERQYDLAVAYNQTGVSEEKCGVLKIYKVPELRGELLLKETASGLGHIVDMLYKERR